MCYYSPNSRWTCFCVNAVFAITIFLTAKSIFDVPELRIAREVSCETLIEWVNRRLGDENLDIPDRYVLDNLKDRVLEPEQTICLHTYYFPEGTVKKWGCSPQLITVLDPQQAERPDCRLAEVVPWWEKEEAYRKREAARRQGANVYRSERQPPMTCGGDPEDCRRASASNQKKEKTRRGQSETSADRG